MTVCGPGQECRGSPPALKRANTSSDQPLATGSLIRLGSQRDHSSATQSSGREMSALCFTRRSIFSAHHLLAGSKRRTNVENANSPRGGEFVHADLTGADSGRCSQRGTVPDGRPSGFVMRDVSLQVRDRRGDRRSADQRRGGGAADRGRAGSTGARASSATCVRPGRTRAAWTALQESWRLL